jgi:transposase
MSKARLVITAVVIEGRSQSEVARAYGVSQPWVSRLVTRWRLEGEAAFEPRSRRPRRSPTATPPQTVELVLRLRKELAEQGLDAGPHTLVWHLEHHHDVRLSAATVHRILTRHGLVTPEPKKRPKASYTRFEADLPNQMWQTDFTHVRLSTGRDVEVLNFLDDTPGCCWPPSLTPGSPDRPSRSCSPEPLTSTAFRPASCPTTAWSSPPGPPAAVAARTPSRKNSAAST